MGVVEAVAGVKVGVVPQIQTKGRGKTCLDAFNAQDVVVAKGLTTTNP